MTEDQNLLEARAALEENVYLRETIIELEMAAESNGWLNLLGASDTEFSRQGLRDINRQARLFWLKNPLIRRGVEVQTHYVFGQGMLVRAPDAEVNTVVQSFNDDAKNRVELTGHQAHMLKETDLRLFGNLFFVFFVDTSSGRVRVRTIPTDEVDDIVCNPEDSKEPWFYLRTWQQTSVEGLGVTRKLAYPDWRYAPKVGAGDSVRNYEIDWEHPVYHIKTGALSDMRFGVSEVYPALDWAKAYKAFLEDWATISKALSRYAHKMTLPTNAGIATAKAKLATTMGTSTGETNPPPVVGSMALLGPGTSLEPMKIGGANVSADDGRRLLLMVAAAMGLPETFFGDSAIGSLATARSLDRPTELQMLDRQTFWSEVYQAIYAFVVEQAIKYGDLKGALIEEPDGTPHIELGVDDEGKDRDPSVIVEFPPLLEHDVAAQIAGIVDAATLKGQPMATVVDSKTVSRLLLQALGVDDVDAAMDVIYPEVDPDAPVEPEPVVVPTVADFANALREVREVLKGMTA
jgi:hypothetical protein